ncbi:MAG: transposase [Burkholderia sp.]
MHAICKRYIELALAEIDLFDMTSIAVDETSYQRRHNYLTLVADARESKVVFVAEGKDAATIKAFIKGVKTNLPNARITFDKFQVVAHVSKAVDPMRRTEQRTDPEFKGLRWPLLKDRDRLTAAQRTDLDALIV